jgi:haloalkane dehalogenase
VEKLPAPELPPWIAKEVPFTRYRIAVGGGLHMHVMETGRGRPVLMVHGNPTWGFLYRKVAMCLQGQRLRLIMPDLIGFGLSDKPRDFSAHTIRNHSKWLGSLIDQLELEEVILVCQDWGGAIGTHPFTTRPHRLAGMVVLNTVLDAPSPGFRPTAFHRFSHLPLISDFVFRVLPLPQAALNLAQGDKSSIRGDVARAYRYPFRRIRDRVAPLATARMAVDRMGHPSIEALQECAAFVRGFGGPKAMVWGRRDPVIARALKRTRALLGNPPVVETQAGHFLQEEVPDEIAAAVLDVSARLSRASAQAPEKQA